MVFLCVRDTTECFLFCFVFVFGNSTEFLVIQQSMRFW